MVHGFCILWSLCIIQEHKDFLLYFLLEVLWAILSAKNGLKLFFTSGCLIASISFAKLAVFYLLYCLCTRSVAQSCLTICDPMNCSTPGFPVLHHLPEFDQTLVYWVSDAIQPSHPLPSPSPPAFNLSQHWDLFQWVGSSNQVAQILELQLQHQFF